MSEFVSIDVQGNDELVAQLADAVRRIQEPRELLESIGAQLEMLIQGRFDAKRDPTGAPWQRLAPSTLEKYRRQDDGRRQGTLLERTRVMRESLEPTVGPDFVNVGMSRLTDDGQWQIPLLHEFGTRRMPRRGLFFADPESGTLSPSDEEVVQREIFDFLDDLFGGS